MNSKDISLLEMLKSGVHFGHQKSRWHPKMKQYIFTERNSVHIIDLEKTRDKLMEALDFLRETASRGGTVVFIGTKKQSQSIILNHAQASGMPYIVNRWIGGLFTNFPVVKKLLNKLSELKRQQESGGWQKYTKKEQVSLKKHLDKLQGLVGGLENLTKIPDAIYVVDVKNEKTAVEEARRKKIPIVALVDTNIDPTKITYPIPANDDATKSIEYITGKIAAAIMEGKDNPVPIEGKEESEKTVPEKEAATQKTSS
ncbi:MAG: 30S ribosomal protein S2 [bacterium]|nr:30S ribosomal protein S2 [bacterium]